MKSCKKIKEKEIIDQYLLGFLSDEEEFEFLKHLRECDSCRQKFETSQNVIKTFSERAKTKAELPSEFRKKIRNEISETRSLRNSQISFSIFKIAASFIIFLSIIGVFFLSKNPKTSRLKNEGNSENKVQIAKMANFSSKTDIKTAIPVWEVPNIRNPYTDSQYPILENGLVYAIREIGTDAKVVSISQKDGSIAWETPFSVIGGLASINGMIFTVSKIENKQELVALNCRNGQIFWKFSLPPENTIKADFSRYEIAAFEEGICFIQGRDIYFLDKDYGTLKWKNEAFFVHCMVSRPQIENGKLFIADTEHLHCIDSRDGAILWTKLPDRNTVDFMKPMVAVTKDKVFITYKMRFGACKLFALSTENGKDLWEKNITLPYWICANQEYIFVKTEKLDFYLANDGRFIRSESVKGTCPPCVVGNSLFMINGKDSRDIISIDIKTGIKYNHAYLQIASNSGLNVANDVAYVPANNGTLYAVPIKLASSN